MVKLVKGTYNGKYGIEMLSDDGLYSIEVYQYPEFKTRAESIISMKCQDYTQASDCFANIEKNIEDVERGPKLYASIII